MDTVWLVRSTFAKKDEAISVAAALLEEKLIACANIEDGVTSVFRWEGAIQTEAEAVLLVKTAAPCVDRLVARLKVLHPYDVPSILAWPADRADADFAVWVGEETRR